MTDRKPASWPAPDPRKVNEPAKRSPWWAVGIAAVLVLAVTAAVVVGAVAVTVKLLRWVF